jgi:two-component system, OmpR family, response regulator MtrA
MRVLIGEDDPDMLDITSYALRKYGFEVVCAADGITLLERWRTERPDLVLLDVNLPLINGMEICKQIRAQSTVPIVMVTSLSDEGHICEGFESGADDYVCKPVSYRALAMRLRTILARHSIGPVLPSASIVESGDLWVDLEGHEVRKGSVAVRMTRLEVRILHFLVANAGRVLPTERLIELVWNYDGGDAFALKTHISHVRQKLGLVKGRHGYIRSLPHVGYTLEAARDLLS